MPKPPLAANVHEHLDVLRDFPAEVALDPVALLDHLAQLDDLGLAEMLGPRVYIDIGLFADLFRERKPNSMDVGEGNVDPLVSREINPTNSRNP